MKVRVWDIPEKNNNSLLKDNCYVTEVKKSNRNNKITIRKRKPT